MPFCSIAYHLFYFFLGEITYITGMVIRYPGIPSNDGSVSVCSFGVQFRVFFNFYAPTLVIGKVRVEIIEFMVRQVINIFFYEGQRKNMTRNIQVHAPVLEPGCIIDAKMRDGPFL